jgi:excisionase family DNA binding protein
MTLKDEILTVAEVAVELRCSRPHVYNLINGKVKGVTQLPALHLGRRKVIRRSAFERWKRANERGSVGDMMAPSLEVDAAGRKKGNLYA